MKYLHNIEVTCQLISASARTGEKLYSKKLFGLLTADDFNYKSFPTSSSLLELIFLKHTIFLIFQLCWKPNQTISNSSMYYNYTIFCYNVFFVLFPVYFKVHIFR